LFFFGGGEGVGRGEILSRVKFTWTRSHFLPWYFLLGVIVLLLPLPRPLDRRHCVYMCRLYIGCVDVCYIEVPPHIQRGPDVTVDIARKHLRVAFKDADGKLVDVVSGELLWDVHKDESMWSLVPGEHVHVSLMCTMLLTDVHFLAVLYAICGSTIYM